MAEEPVIVPTTAFDTAITTFAMPAATTETVDSFFSCGFCGVTACPVLVSMKAFLLKTTYLVYYGVRTSKIRSPNR